MATFNVRNIGSVDFTNNDDGYWMASAMLDQSEVEVDFNTSGGEMTRDMLDRVERFVAELDSFDVQARKAISADFISSEDSSSRLYLSHHIEELSAEERIECFGTENTELDLSDLVSALTLRRVGLYPEEESRTAVFDYTIGSDITDYLLVVEFSQNGLASDVSMES